MKITSDDISFRIKFSAAIDNERGFGSTKTILLTDADWAINNVEYPILEAENAPETNKLLNYPF